MAILVFAGVLSIPSAVFAEDMEDGAVWYGSLRAGLESSGGNVKFVDNLSRWGIRGSSEVSDGLTAVYNFESKIDSSNAGQPGGRLSNIGLSGGFGTVSFGQLWSASENHVGFVDNTQFYGADHVTARVGSTLSYAYSTDVMSLQTDLILNDGDGVENDPSKSIQEYQFGLTVNIGDIGRVGLAYIDDKYTLDPGKDMLVGVKRMLGQTGTVNSNPVIIPTSNTDTTPLVLDPNAFATGSVNGDITVLDALLINDPTAAGYNKINKDDLDTSDKVVTNRYKVGNVIVERSVTDPVGTADNTATTTTDESQMTHTYKYYDADSGKVLDLADDGDDDTAWNTKTTALAAQFSLGNATMHVGVAKVKATYDGHPHDADATASANKETDVTFFGIGGGLGDTGLGYHFHWRDEETSKPWVAGLTKSLGGGASIQLEHANHDGSKNDDGSKKSNQTNLGFRVDF